MKRNLLCFVLCVFMFVGAFVFTACNGSGYNLNNFNADYEKIATSNKNINLTTNGSLQFDFSTIIQLVGEEDTAYAYPLTNYYQTLTNNSLTFIVHTKKLITNANKSVSKDNRNKIKVELDDLTNKFKEVDNQITEFSKILSNTTSQDESRKDYYFILTEAFVNMFDSCRTLSATVADVYFGSVLSNENYNYYENKNNIAATLSTSIKDLTTYHIHNLTQNYIEMNVDGGDETNIELTFDNYLKDVNALNDYLLRVKDANFVNDKLVGLASKLYLLNGKIINEREMYLEACSKVVYSQSEDASDYNIVNCVKIIQGYRDTLAEYTTTLLEIYKSAI